MFLTACGNNDKKASSVSSSNSTSSQNINHQIKNAPKIDWRKSSENKPYPDMNIKNNNWLLVSIKKQRVYVMSSKNKVLYTMYCSTGSDNGDNMTPRGTYSIQAERGSHFYNAASGEGANYWTSWKDHGIYLFHSVPVNKAGKYLMKDAHQLGKKANSHGCIRLSVPDAKWINQHVPFGTKVEIK
ncbi:L,D-transpeptidase [Apilactobacillus apisilvae]